VSFVSPRPPVFLLASPGGTLTVSGRQNSLFPLGLVIKCFLSCISRVHNKSKIYKDWVIFQLFQTWKSIKKYQKPRSQTLCILQPIRQPFSSVERKALVRDWERVACRCHSLTSSIKSCRRWRLGFRLSKLQS